MKIDNTGIHITSDDKTMIVEPSLSQNNALAFMDEDGTWIHMDKNTIIKLYQYMTKHSNNNQSNINQGTIDLDSPFAS